MNWLSIATAVLLAAAVFVGALMEQDIKRIDRQVNLLTQQVIVLSIDKLAKEQK